MEQWKVIEEFPNYEISNLGNVRRRIHSVTNAICTYEVDSIPIKPFLNSKGYYRVQLCKNGLMTKKFVHRLVAEAFIDNPEYKPCVNHIDCNPRNNAASNLEWCTHKENMEWMVKMGRTIRTPEQIEHLRMSQTKYAKSVIGTNLMTGEKVRFDFLNEVENMGFQPSCVCQCCKGIRRTHKGYRWEYA